MLTSKALQSSPESLNAHAAVVNIHVMGCVVLSQEQYDYVEAVFDHGNREPDLTSSYVATMLEAGVLPGAFLRALQDVREEQFCDVEAPGALFCVAAVQHPTVNGQWTFLCEDGSVVTVTPEGGVTNHGRLG